MSTRPASLDEENEYLLVQREPVVDSGWQDEQVSPGHLNPDPLVFAIAHVKVAAPSQDEPDLFIRV